MKISLLFTLIVFTMTQDEERSWQLLLSQSALPLIRLPPTLQTAHIWCSQHFLLWGAFVMSSCAYPGFPGILLCRFLCPLSLCMLVTSGSPCEPILLIALLIYDSMHAVLLHIQLCATPTFKVINIYITEIWVYHR